jgi:hypothetical protein
MLRFARTSKVRTRLPGLPPGPRVELMRGICSLMERDTDAGMRALQALVDTLADGEQVLSVRVRLALGAAQQADGQTDAAVVSFETGLRELEGCDRPDLEGAMLHYLSLAERARGREGAERAREHLLRAASIFARLGHHKRHVSAVALLCVVEADLRLPGVDARIEELLVESRRVGATFFDQRTGLLAAQLAIEAGRLGEARQRLESMPVLRPLMESARRLVFGICAYLAGDLRSAREELDRAVFPDRAADAHLLACYRAVVDGVQPPDPPMGADPPLITASAVVRAGAGLSVALDQACEAHLDLRLLRLMVRRRATVEVGPEGSWFRTLGGEAVDLGRKRVLARLLCTLAEAGDRPVSPSVLREAAWPGERMSEASARNRLHVAVAELRKLGLRDALISVDGGSYALHVLRAP